MFVALLGMMSQIAFALPSEHHLLLCGNPPAQVMEAFQLSSKGGERREVVYFDTRHVSFYKAGVILRLRLTGSKKAKVDLKLRPMLPQNLPKKWRKDKRVKCEYDMTFKRKVGSCRLRETMSRARAIEILKSGEFVRLFSEDQIAFSGALQDKSLPWKSLGRFGPTTMYKWSANRFSFDVEIVELPTGEHLAEISTKKSTSTGDYEYGLVKLANSKSLTICKVQDSKTKRVLAAFSRVFRVRR